jgi:hypothetical protein
MKASLEMEIERREYGLIAQEVREAIPAAVADGDPLGIKPMALISVLINAVKELADRIERLENGRMDTQRHNRNDDASAAAQPRDN